MVLRGGDERMFGTRDEEFLGDDGGGSQTIIVVKFYFTHGCMHTLLCRGFLVIFPSNRESTRMHVGISHIM